MQEQANGWWWRMQPAGLSDTGEAGLGAGNEDMGLGVVWRLTDGLHRT